MPFDLKQFLRLKEEVEEARSQAEQAKGAAKQIQARLKDEFGCKDLEAAEKLDATLAKEEKKLEREYEKAEEAFMDKWQEKLR